MVYGELWHLGIFNLVVGGVQARLMRMQAISSSHLNANEITENIWVGGANSPELVAKQNFSVVFDLREFDDSKYVDVLKSHGIEYINVKILDHYGASPEILSQIVAEISQKVSEGKKILVHCNLGRGRSTLVVAAYLISQGMSPEDAKRKIREKRSVTYMNEKQRKALNDYADAFFMSSKGNL